MGYGRPQQNGKNISGGWHSKLGVEPPNPPGNFHPAYANAICRMPSKINYVDKAKNLVVMATSLERSKNYFRLIIYSRSFPV